MKSAKKPRREATAAAARRRAKRSALARLRDLTRRPDAQEALRAHRDDVKRLNPEYPFPAGF